MTPWGLRAKLKSALGRGQPAPADETVSLTLVMPGGQEHTVRCEPRYTLVMASQTLDTPIATNCPDGHCGDCAVDVLDATGLLPATPAEARILEEKKLGSGVRLACHAKVGGSGAKVKVRRVWTMDSVRGA